MPGMDKLSSSENVLWSGRPRQGLMLRGADMMMIPFSLLWGGFAVYWEMSVIAADAPLMFKLWGIPFILMGIHMVIGRFFIEAWQRSRTFYMITNERAIITSGLFQQRVKSIELRTLVEFALTEGRSGEGTISFGVTPAGDMFSGLTSWPGVESQPRFDTVPDARNVYELIRSASYEASRTRPAVQLQG